MYTTASANSTNYGRSCALLSDATVKCWGQLPTYGATSTPTPISGLSNVVDFSMSQTNQGVEGHWCAALSDGTVKCAGTGNYGQLGNGAATSTNWISGAVTVTGISTAVRVYAASSGYSTNYGYSCALLASGKHACWGSNYNGRLGIPFNINASFNVPFVDSPIVASTATGTVSLSQQNSSWEGHACAVTATGSVICWGRGDWGQLGNGTTSTAYSATPISVAGVANAVKVYTASAGYSTDYGRSCALLSDATVKCWGYLPIAGTTTTPTLISGLSNVVDFSMSPGNSSAQGHWCAALSDGTMRCAGTGDRYQLGIGGNADRNWLSGTGTVAGVANAVKVYTASAGYSTDFGRSCALLSDATVKCWGYLPTYGATSTPTPISGLSNVVDFSMSAGGYNTFTWLGEGHWCAVISDGTMRCAGTGDYWQNGVWWSTNWITGASTVSGIGNAVRVYTASSGYSTNYGRSCALLSDATVKCWGYLPHAGTASAPTLISGLSNVADFSMSAGNEGGLGHWCAALSDGTVKCAGTGNYGQLGNGAATSTNWTSGAVTVSGIRNAIRVFAASSSYSTDFGYSCALLSDATVKCWGSNHYGRLGINYNINSTIGSPYVDDVNLWDLSLSQQNEGGQGHSCGISGSGQVYCWGMGNYGQLGNGTAVAYIGTPTAAFGVANAVRVYTASSGYSTNYGRSCALLSDATVKCWGYLPHAGTASAPTLISGLSNVADFSMSQGNDVGLGHWCAALSDGTVKCAGTGDYGQLGNGASSNTDWISGAVTVTGISTAVRVYTASSGYSTNYGYSCALLSDGTVKCWGAGNSGRLWNNSTSTFNAPVSVSASNGIYYAGIGGTSIDQTIPAAVVGINSATSVAAGAYHVCAINAGTVQCFGYNPEGQLGNSSTNNSTNSVAVVWLSGVTRIASGYMHTCAILADATVKCWGLGTQGQLGNSGNTSSNIPVAVTGLAGAVEISAGDYHTCALLSNGTAKCWGLNIRGQLGNGQGISSNTPVAVAGIAGATRIASGADHTCTLSSGAVSCWGAGNFGQLGNSSYRWFVSLPTVVPGITTASRIDTGAYHTCATLADGNMRCWGLNAMAQQGASGYYSTNSPMTLYSVQNILASAGGIAHTCTITNDLSTVSCFGGNYHGQIGIGTLINTTAPTSLTYTSSDTSNASSYSVALCETRDTFNGNLGGIDGANALCGAQCWQGYKFLREAELANFPASSVTANTYWVDRSQANNCSNWTNSSSGSGATVSYAGYSGTGGVMNALSAGTASCTVAKQLVCGRGIR